MTEIWAGTPVAERILSEARAAVEAGRSRGWPTPVLTSVHRGEETPFQFYLRRQERAASQAGIELRPRALPPGAGPELLEETLAALDADAAVHGVLLEHPLPPPFDFARALGRLRAEKDIDGVGWSSLGRLLHGTPVHVPAVAAAALEILRHYGRSVGGKRVSVIGRSATVGLPLALMLLSRGAGGDATVTVAHSRTVDLAAALRGSELIMSCVGHPGLLTREVVPEGAAVVDIGLSSRPDPERPGRQHAVGDAAADELMGWASAITPVPGGVGPVTVAELMRSTVRAWSVLEGGRPR